MAVSFSMFIDPNFSAEERRAIGRAAIDYIRARTRKGRGIDNQPFVNKDGEKGYSKAYQEHRDFAIGGKSKKPINLTLTGDMLSSLEVIDISLPGKIEIGILDDENAEKARWMREKGYDFLGISQKEQDIILAKFSKFTAQEIRTTNLIESIAEEFLRDLVRRG